MYTQVDLSGQHPSILTQTLMVGECPVSSFRSCPDKLLDHLQRLQAQIGVFCVACPSKLSLRLKTTQSDVRPSCQKC